MIWPLSIWALGAAVFAGVILSYAGKDRPDGPGDWTAFVIFCFVWPVWSVVLTWEAIRERSKRG